MLGDLTDRTKRLVLPVLRSVPWTAELPMETVVVKPSTFSGLGHALRWLRERQTRKQYQVADLAGITKGMLSAYETGRQHPSIGTLDKLLETLGCDLNDLHKQWYDHTMKGGPSPKFLKKPVTYYVPGAEEWKYADSLEAIPSKPEKLYLAREAADAFHAGRLHLLQELAAAWVLTGVLR